MQDWMRSDFDAGRWLSALVQSPQWGLFATGIDDQSSTQRVFVRVWNVMMEVNNGGLNQYFFNSYSDRAFETVEALAIIGADEAAAVLKRACEAFGAEGPPQRREARQQRLKQIDPSLRVWKAADDELIRRSDAIDRLLVGYVVAHPH